MPPAKKPTPPRSRARSFKEPAALKRLSRSLDAAHEALGELRNDTGRDVSQGAQDVYKDLRTFVSSARRDTGKLARALARDFEQAERRLSRSTPSRNSPAGSATRKSPRASSKRATGTGRKR